MTTTTDLTKYTDLVIVGTGEDIAALTAIARAAGALVYRTAPRPAGPNDPRHRVLLRLHLHHP
jgi:fructose-1,6-bisphosphatase/inositol monophosphatase family enzyme